jgi:hypothetical protein
MNAIKSYESDMPVCRTHDISETMITRTEKTARTANTQTRINPA